MEVIQEEYNNDINCSVTPKNNVTLYLFYEVCFTCIKIQRALQAPEGNAIILSTGGKGGNSLCKLAIFLNQSKIYEYGTHNNSDEMRYWRDDLKKATLRSILQKQNITFFIPNKIILDSRMMEDLNNLIQLQQITFFSEKEYEDIIQQCKMECVKLNIETNRQNINMIVTKKLQQHFHFAQVTSPGQDNFYQAVRDYPFIIKQCQIITIHNYNEETLQGVGQTLLLENDLEIILPPNFTSENNKQIVEILIQMYTQAKNFAQEQYKELKNQAYIESHMFFELINIYKNVYSKKYQEIEKVNISMNQGIQNLEQAQKHITVLQENIKINKPQLQKNQIELIDLMENLKNDQIQNEKDEITFIQEEKDAIQMEKEAKIIKKDTELGLAQALKELDETTISISKIKKDHLTEIKSLVTPPSTIQIIVTGLVILFEKQLEQKGVVVPLKQIQQNECFDIAKKNLLNQPQELLDSIIHFDRKSVNEDQIEKLQQYVFSTKEFQPQSIERQSNVAKYLYTWLNCILGYSIKKSKLVPMQEKIEQMEKEVIQKSQDLINKKQQLTQVKQRILDLQKEIVNKQEEKQYLQKNIELYEVQLERALILTQSLNEEKNIWLKQVQINKNKYQFIQANSLLVASQLVFFGPFDIIYRRKMLNSWKQILTQEKIIFNEELQLEKFLISENQLVKWLSQGLSRDEASVQNASIMNYKVNRWDLILDPQNQGLEFIKQQRETQIVNQNDPNLFKQLEICVQQGKIFAILVNSADFYNQLSVILDKKVQKNPNQELNLIIQDKYIQLNPLFKLFFVIQQANIELIPDVYIKLRVINFILSEQQFEEQILHETVLIENQNLEKQKIQLQKDIAQDKQKVYELEEQILNQLSETNDILEIINDSQLVENLTQAQQITQTISQRINNSIETQNLIDKSRMDYIIVAQRAKLLFFSILNLQNVNYIYKYSIDWFKLLFIKCFENLKHYKNFEERIQGILDVITEQIYNYVCQGIFEQDKLLFKFLITIKYQMDKNQINLKEWEFFIDNQIEKDETQESPFSFLPTIWWQQMSGQLNTLSEIPEYELLDDITESSYKDIFESFIQHQQPYEYHEFYQKLQKQGFQKLVLIKAIRPNYLLDSINKYSDDILKEILKNQNQNLDLEQLYEYSDPYSPIIFFLQDGTDPREIFYRFAEDKRMKNKMQILSIGKGSFSGAENAIKRAKIKGEWVFLENAHYSIDILNQLLILLDKNPDNEISKNCRIWLTLKSTEQIPTRLLQKGIKISMSQTAGIKHNILNIYKNTTDVELNDCNKIEFYQKLLMSVSFFHSVIQERKRYLSLGWNYDYDFNASDLKLSFTYLKIILEDQTLNINEQNKNVNYVNYPLIYNIIGDINYGGKVYDLNDKILLSKIIKTFLNEKTLEEPEFSFTPTNSFKMPPIGNQKHYINEILKMPQTQSQDFMFHPNANILIGYETANKVTNLLQIIFHGMNQNLSIKQQLYEQDNMLDFILYYVKSKIPPNFNMLYINNKFGNVNPLTLNSLLLIEAQKYNNMLEIISNTIDQLNQAIQGYILLTQHLELIALCLIKKKIPQQWKKYGFMSDKPLSSWLKELNERINYLNNWIHNQEPQIFWLPCFFNIECFLASQKQIFLRKQNITGYQVKFEIHITDEVNTCNTLQAPNKGFYADGIYLEGAEIDIKTKQLIDPKPLQIFTKCPIIHFDPEITIQDTLSDLKKQQFQCPFYKTISRSEIGNFIMYLIFEISQDNKKTQDEWLISGTAAFLTNNF